MHIKPSNEPGRVSLRMLVQGTVPMTISSEQQSQAGVPTTTPCTRFFRGPPEATGPERAGLPAHCCVPTEPFHVINAARDQHRNCNPGGLGIFGLAETQR